MSHRPTAETVLGDAPGFEDEHTVAGLGEAIRHQCSGDP